MKKILLSGLLAALLLTVPGDFQIIQNGDASCGAAFTATSQAVEAASAEKPRVEKKKKTKKAKAVIGIDPGHQSKGNNGKEPNGPGSSVMKTKVAGGTSGVSTKKPEYQLTLEIGLKLRDELTARGYQVVMTRETNDVDISNKERAEKLNASCDIAIRLHADGAASSATGASMQCHTSKNPYIANLYEDSNRLSSCILSSYCAGTGIRNRGIAYRDDLTGTNWSTIPVTLLEMGFMTNTSDDSYMSSEAGQKAMVKGIADGIDAYFQ